jgi:hypothetical protein
MSDFHLDPRKPHSSFLLIVLFSQIGRNASCVSPILQSMLGTIFCLGSLCKRPILPVYISMMPEHGRAHYPICGQIHTFVISFSASGPWCVLLWESRCLAAAGLKSWAFQSRQRQYSEGHLMQTSVSHPGKGLGMEYREKWEWESSFLSLHNLCIIKYWGVNMGERLFSSYLVIVIQRIKTTLGMAVGAFI